MRSTVETEANVFDEQTNAITDEELVEMFRIMWDEFPGMARLIDDKHVVLAANPFAEERGFVPGAVCVKLGDPAIHRGCKHRKMFETGKAQYDHVMDDRVRGWMPVVGRPDVCVHFAVMIPEE